MQVEDYFRGKGCLVTGAASGIGFVVSEALLNVGAVVFMADRNTKALVELPMLEMAPVMMMKGRMVLMGSCERVL